MQEKYYVINELVMFTGLTDRTIRNYLSSGILQGEKVDGMWRFTSDQVEEFVKHPAVRPSILAKKNGLVYDFLADDQKKTQEVCVILDILGKLSCNYSSCLCHYLSSCWINNILSKNLSTDTIL